MILPCPQPGGLPPGRALHPGEEVGKGPAAPPGSICGSHAIAEPAGFLLPLLRAVVHPGAASSASPAFRKRHHEKEVQAWSWAGQAPQALKAKAITRPVRATQSLPLDCELADMLRNVLRGSEGQGLKPFKVLPETSSALGSSPAQTRRGTHRELTS